jgi:hypothetical protein
MDNMKKNIHTPLVDEHLEALKGMQEATTDPFFYTRLEARMSKRFASNKGWQFPLKPVWLIGILVLTLAVNGYMIAQQLNREEEKQVTTDAASSLIQNFAEVYNLNISSSY